MKILFICSSLEPGRDGVGDYVRKLGGEFVNNNNKINLLAYNDPFVKDGILKENKYSNNNRIATYRFASSLSSRTRLKELKKLKKELNPDWISLQYVGFGFNKYGLPIDLLFLRSFIGTTRLHIMFHELWCGLSPNAGIKEKILGRLQKQTIKLLIFFSKPEKVFTNTQKSAKDLLKFGVTPILAPVFSNMSIHERGSEEEWAELKSAFQFGTLNNDRQNWLILGFFGTIYNRPGLDKLLQDAQKAATAMNKKMGIIAIGNSRVQKASDIAKNLKEVRIWETGILKEAMVNRVMHYVDLGVVTTSADVLSKSGSAIAWLERGVPILLSGEDQSYIKHDHNLNGVHQIEDENSIISAFNAKGNIPKNDILKDVANSYNTHLLKIKKPFS